jgi:DNA polymerase III subunit epsilon
MSVGTPWRDGELLGFDLETTGTNRLSDVPVSFALVTAYGGHIVGQRAALVDPGRSIPEGAVSVHGITTERARADGVPLAEATSLMVEALVRAGRRAVPVVGMRLDFDLTILDAQSRRLFGAGLIDLGWRGPALDVSVLDRHLDRYRKGPRKLTDLCEHYEVGIDRAHDAGADARAAVAVLLAMTGRFGELDWPLAALHAMQIVWHWEWAMSYDRWRCRNDLVPLDRQDREWPIAVRPFRRSTGTAVA